MKLNFMTFIKLKKWTNKFKLRKKESEQLKINNSPQNFKNASLDGFKQVRNEIQKFFTSYPKGPMSLINTIVGKYV